MSSGWASSTWSGRPYRRASGTCSIISRGAPQDGLPTATAPLPPLSSTGADLGIARCRRPPSRSCPVGEAQRPHASGTTTRRGRGAPRNARDRPQKRPSQPAPFGRAPRTSRLPQRTPPSVPSHHHQFASPPTAVPRVGNIRMPGLIVPRLHHSDLPIDRLDFSPIVHNVETVTTYRAVRRPKDSADDAAGSVTGSLEALAYVSHIHRSVPFAPPIAPCDLPTRRPLSARL